MIPSPDFAVFVPAIMSVGLLVSMGTLLRDALHWSGARTRRRRTIIEGGGTLAALRGEESPTPEELGVLSKPSYLLSAVMLVGGAAYVAIGSVANFVRDGGYVRDISWLLAVSLVLSVVLGFLGGVSLAVYRAWPNPPSWTYGSLQITPLSMTPGTSGTGPSWGLGVGILLSAVVTLIISLMVGTGRSVAREIDRPILDWLGEIEELDWLGVVDPFGSTIISLAFVVLIGLAGFRCRVMAIAYPASFVATWVLGEILRQIVSRPRPVDVTDFQSFPSGHLVQAVFVAGLVPIAVRCLFGDERLAIVSRVVLGLAVLATALHRVHEQSHWPLDIVAGASFGLTFVLATQWVLDHQAWHRSCDGCPWSAEPSETPWTHGVVRISPHVTRWLGWLGVALGLGAAVVLAVLSVLVGLPTDPEGYGIGSEISGPFQIGLAGLIAVGALTAIRWKGVGAFLMALAAIGLGLFAAVQYRPSLAVALTALLLIPAVVTWFAWQPNETVGRIAVLAVATTTALVVTTLGSREVYAYYFGPSHPDSVAASPGWEHVEWYWVGGVSATAATVVAGGLPAGEGSRLHIATEGRTIAVDATADEDGVARFEATGLQPAARHLYAVGSVGADRVASIDDRPLTALSAEGSFTTPAEGAQNLTIVAGSCARTSTNGAVFDAMRADRPDLFLALGDLHYANLGSTDPDRHLAQYEAMLQRPATAALFSSVPTAYVWDDHDFGPNDTDSSSPSRLAVSAAYRQAVPHHGVDSDPAAPISQAFTVGRVRIVLSDTRSQRTSETMLGADQLDWLVQELVDSSATHALVVWANPTPWVSEEGPDDWSNYADERAYISNALAAAAVDNLVMVSGDAHMVAIDDGTNTDYSTSGTAGFPLLHAAALDRPGSVKGGPYSHGAIGGGGQYGRIDVVDDGGDVVEVTLTGNTWDGEELLRYRFEVEVG